MNGSPSGKAFAEGKGLLRRHSTRVAAAVAAGALALAGSGIAWADDIKNTLDGSVDATAETMALNVGGAQGSTTLALVETNGDGKNGCNLTGSSTLTLSIASSDPAVATVSPSLATFTSCGFTQPLSVSAVGEGSATITASIVSNTSTGSFDVGPATFAVNVVAPAPSNTAPVLSISGVTNGGSYEKGTVPTAVCDVVDKEDGANSFNATLGSLSGPDAANGIGTQEATCSHEDTGGLKLVSSVTYNIVDETAPKVSYTLTPADPDGDNGWYNTDVAVQWIVIEEDSTSTVHRTGCEDQIITEDQVAEDYSCTATSAGGTSETIIVNLKKDGTAPTVASAGATGTEGTNSWYTSDVEASFTGTDATSGLLATTQTVTSSGEGVDVKVDSPAFTDLAGNTTPSGAATQTFKIDKTAPTVEYKDASGTLGADDWYRSDVVATFTGTDVTSGPLTATQTATSEGEGKAVKVESPAFSDDAGNTTPAGAASQTFKIDLTAPTVTFDSIVADSYYGSTPAEPTCTASDELSGLVGDCKVEGYSSAVGGHTLTAKATDKAGNETIITQSYEVKAWTLKGFYQPIDMEGVLNTVKGGSTVPAKFEIFAGDTELTDPALASFAMKPIQCSLLSPQDAIETVTTGSTSLRYDATAGQFVYNWKTPTGTGNCYRLVMTADDGSSISASFKLK
ncbi:hypothetical protein FBY31_2494 [Arthrobacter sp. SLBN-100]|uniref:PxKF domain-containing protein n=1 Tax=Arthrobacter sp. SLBN-100 TaxID=2768450 RepID=UPI0011504D25|nr:PxKF domain-containing protein [Arthrobacter sp. SLBN-100]TQJ68403.1 hypothetical protein FBY31_2494 [Arthrobacter sp. SLBN-100]